MLQHNTTGIMKGLVCFITCFNFVYESDLIKTWVTGGLSDLQQGLWVILTEPCAFRILGSYCKSKLELKSNLSEILPANCKFICNSTPT